MASSIRHRRCKVCGGGPDEVGQISARGLCAQDGNARMQRNNAEIRARSGPAFEHWYQQMHVRFEHPRLPAAE